MNKGDSVTIIAGEHRHKEAKVILTFTTTTYIESALVVTETFDLVALPDYYFRPLSREAGDNPPWETRQSEVE